MCPVIRPQIGAVATSGINHRAKPSRCGTCPRVKNLGEWCLLYISSPCFRNTERVEQHPMVGERMLREAAIGQNQPADPVIEQLSALVGPSLAAVARVSVAKFGQPRATHKKTSGLASSMIVVLRDGIKRSEGNAPAMRL